MLRILSALPGSSHPSRSVHSVSFENTRIYRKPQRREKDCGLVGGCCYLSVVCVKQFLDFVDQDVTNAVERLSLGRKHVCSELPQRAAVLIRRLILNLRSLPLYLQVRVADGGGRCLHGRSLRFDGIDGFADVTVTFRCHSVGVYCEKRAVGYKMSTKVNALNMQRGLPKSIINNCLQNQRVPTFPICVICFSS